MDFSFSSFRDSIPLVTDTAVSSSFINSAEWKCWIAECWEADPTGGHWKSESWRERSCFETESQWPGYYGALHESGHGIELTGIKCPWSRDGRVENVYYKNQPTVTLWHSYNWATKWTVTSKCWVLLWKLVHSN